MKMENRFRPLGIEGMAFALREVMSIWSDKWRDRDGEAESMGRDHENGHQLCAGGGQVGRGANWPSGGTIAKERRADYRVQPVQRTLLTNEIK
jgi:hypothetical protein